MLQKFDVVEIPKGKSYDLVERVTLQEDMKIEWEQTQILWNLMENSPTAMVGVDEVCLLFLLCVVLYINLFIVFVVKCSFKFVCT